MIFFLSSEVENVFLVAFAIIFSLDVIVAVATKILTEFYPARIQKE
ncbi:hypothetical protein LEP1GSC060_1443 [Leptospira weilii serovar Ranarum str. ICFT]|uniref:Uncharacterized protein n=1 Tax=Leptospira weilii serovar Ranarum str. ICFT TaxID=1218598 RepID=N1WHP8_9LEPT|nr:hypothetical protein LEP1GSC060_1443 [Leptospira weilii serovar Ranarum str. ICFT]